MSAATTSWMLEEEEKRSVDKQRSVDQRFILSGGGLSKKSGELLFVIFGWFGWFKIIPKKYVMAVSSTS